MPKRKTTKSKTTKKSDSSTITHLKEVPEGLRFVFYLIVAAVIFELVMLLTGKSFSQGLLGAGVLPFFMYFGAMLSMVLFLHAILFKSRTTWKFSLIVGTGVTVAMALNNFIYLAPNAGPAVGTLYGTSAVFLLLPLLIILYVYSHGSYFKN
jgi:hypothetical protein